jgi:hypothetical protein
MHPMRFRSKQRCRRRPSWFRWRFVREVEPPRLRPVWRWSAKIAVALVTCTLMLWGTRVAAFAFADHEWNEIKKIADQRLAEMQAQRNRELDAARRVTSGYDCVPHDRPLCDEDYDRYAAEDAQRSAKERLNR